MSIKTIKVKVGNNLNAVVKGGTNVNAVAVLKPENALSYTTPQISGGGFCKPFELGYDSEDPKLTIEVRANTLGEDNKTVKIPLNASELVIDLEGTHNGKIDIETTFS